MAPAQGWHAKSWSVPHFWSAWRHLSWLAYYQMALYAPEFSSCLDFFCIPTNQFKLQTMTWQFHSSKLMYDPLTIWFYASKGIWVDFPRKWKLALLQIKWPSIMKLSVSIVLLRRPIVDTPQRLQIKVCTTTRSEAVPSSLDFFIKFALSFSDKWMSSDESHPNPYTWLGDVICFNYIAFHILDVEHF